MKTQSSLKEILCKLSETGRNSGEKWEKFKKIL